MKPEEKSFETKDGREFTFLFDFDGLIATEDCANGASGTANLKQIVGGAVKGRLGYLSALVVGGLQAHHPGLTRNDACALIDSDGKALGAALWAAFFAAMPARESGSNPRLAPSGTGSRSSAPGAKKGSTKRASGSKPRAATRSS